jgi:hypothetical protein
MTKIVPIRYSDIEKVRKMIEYVSPDVSAERLNEESFIPFPFNTLHGLLPVHLKFLQESYVAVEGDELLGLISLAPDGNKKTRWKINRLILNPNAYDAGKQLIDFVVNKFGGAGAEIFLTSIDENYTEAISLFKNACFFRSWSKVNIWEFEDLKKYNKKEIQIVLRPVTSSDSERLQILDTEALLPQFKTAFLKSAKDFKFGMKEKISNGMKGYKIWRYVLDNQQLNSIEGLLSITSTDNTVFWVEITLTLAYQEYYEDILAFALNHIHSLNKNSKVFVGVKEHYQSCKKMTEILNLYNFKPRATFEILIKDYWKPAEYSVEKKVPIMLFPDITSPACNVIRFIKNII